MKRPFIIAEIGFNHEGNLDNAFRMIEDAAEAGADAAKFQIFKAEDLVLPTSEHFKTISNGELNSEAYKELATFALEKNIEFMSTPFGLWAVDLLEKLAVKRYKIASMDATNCHLLKNIATTKKEIILSTGMCTLNEIESTLEFLDKNNSGKVTLLHCTSEYPTKPEEVNMSFMRELKNRFSTSVGYSDHSIGIDACLLAHSMGAEVIEKHFTDLERHGLDEEHSLDKKSLKVLVDRMSLNMTMCGNSKFDSRVDKKNTKAFRRGIYLNKEIASGCEIKEKDLFFVRPENGTTMDSWQKALGIAKKDYKAFESFN